MSDTIQAAGFIVHDNELIHGVGATADEAWADMKQTMDAANISLLEDDADSEAELGSWTLASDMKLRAASADLLRDVVDRGGNCGWYVVGGVACTRDEAGE